MRSHIKRLSLALLLSGASFGGTYIWYKNERAELDRKLSSGDVKPLAQIVSVSNEVQKNQSNNLMWVEVNTGDTLYDGDSIQTSKKGMVKINFQNQGYIDVEPDSLIKIEQSQGEIALNLVEGSLFVKGGGESTDGKKANQLVLNSANGKIDLSQASASLAKTKGEVSLQVLEGKAKVQGKDGKSSELSSGSTGKLGSTGVTTEKYDLKILSPAPQKPYYVDPESNRVVTFKWLGYPKDWKVSLWVGPSRSELADSGAFSQPGSSTLSIPLSMGSHYWKLVAKDASEKVVAESPVYKTDLMARYAPTVIFPTADAQIPMETFPMDMTFKWDRGNEDARVTFEIAKDPLMNQKVAVKSFSKEESFILPKLNAGTYYWRMSAKYHDAEKPIEGKVQRFTLEKIGKTAPRDPVQIIWGLKPEQTTQYYINSPELDLQWAPKNRSEEVTNWRIKLIEENSDPQVSSEWSTKDLKYKAPVAKPGRYIASIEAYDKEGNLIGTSDKKALTVEQLPRLKPPEITTKGGVVQAFADGGADIQWNTVNGAKEYVLTIQNVTQNQTKEFKMQKNQALFKPLTLNPKNEYKVKVEVIDQYGRKSLDGQFVKLDVPLESNIRAPKLKGIKIKTNE